MTIYKRHPKSVFSHPFFSAAFDPDAFTQAGDDLKAPTQSSAPTTTAPWDLIKTGDQDWRIDAVLAGLSLDDIDITQDGQQLSITTKAREAAEGEYIRQGRSTTPVNLSFRLGEHVEVISATLDKGVLSVRLKQNLPEELQPRKITVEAGDPAA